jgi:hypothetical protein
MPHVLSDVPLPAQRPNVVAGRRPIVRAARTGYRRRVRLYVALRRSILRDGCIFGGLDGLPDAVRRELGIERSVRRRMADQDARLHAEALLST